MHTYWGAFLYKGGGWVRGGGLAKNVPHKEEGQENLNMASPHLHQPSLPLNNDPSLINR